MGGRYGQSEIGRWDETLGDVLGVEVKHRFADEPVGAGTMGGRWAKRGSRRWQGVLLFSGYIAVADKRKASVGVEIDSFETIGFGTMPMGDETLSEHRRLLAMGRWEGVSHTGEPCLALRRGVRRGQSDLDGGEKLLVVGRLDSFETKLNPAEG